MMKRILASCVVVTAALAAPAYAQNRPADSGFYGGLGLGRSDSNLGGATDNKDSAWKAFGGYQFNRYFALEGGYVDLGSTAIPGATFDSKAWQASAVGSLPLSEQFSLTGKLGVAQTETEVSLGGTDHNTDPTYGLGLRYNFTRQFGIRGEWERFRVSGNPIVGKSDTDIYSINAIFRF